MKKREKFERFTEPVFDVHLHCYRQMPVRETAQRFAKIFEETNVQKMAFLSLPFHGKDDRDDAQNLKALYYKTVFSPKGYALAGLVYDFSMTNEQMAEDLVKQAKTFFEVGFDGIKILEGCVDTRVKMEYDEGGDFSLVGSVYEPFWAYMEKIGKPIIIHNAHPPIFWDKENIPQYWIDRGCFYGEGEYIGFEECIQQMFTIMERHPNLKLILAHHGFLTYDYDKVEKWLSYPNTGLDITPGGEAFIDMSKDIEKWKKLYIKYIDRFYYGTDTHNFVYNNYPNEKEWLFDLSYRPYAVHSFFECEEFLNIDTQGNWTYYPAMNLEEKYRKKVYMENAEKLLGKTPAKVDLDYCIKEAEKFQKVYQTGSLQRYDIDCILRDIKEIKADMENK